MCHCLQTGEFIRFVWVLVHCGEFRGHEGGHYIALVCDVQNNWYAIDNEDVTLINNIKRMCNDGFVHKTWICQQIYLIEIHY